MEQTLIASGIACIIAAIVGGGLKAFKIEIPVLQSVARQVSLGFFGALLIGAAFILNSNQLNNNQPESNNDSRQGQVENSTPSNNNSGNNGNGSVDEPSDNDPPPDFPGGSARVYSANFADWTKPSTEHGSISLGFGNALVLQPSSNTWIGAYTKEITDVEGDFVCDLRFRIEERSSDASIHLNMGNVGEYAEQLDLYFSVWSNDEVNYSLMKGFVRSDQGEVPQGLTEETIADRAEPPARVQNYDWSTGSELTLKRTGGVMQFFINDQFITEFTTSVFPIKEALIGGAFQSKMVITSLEFRTPS